MIQSHLSMHFLSNSEVEITVKGFERAGFIFSSKKVADLNPFSRLAIWLSEKIWEKKFVCLQVDDQPTLVKIDEIKDLLDVSKQEILAAEKAGVMHELIITASEASHYHVRYEVVSDYKQKNILGELRRLEKLADRYDLPLNELLKAQSEGKLPTLLEETELVETQCERAFRQLDFLYLEAGRRFYTKHENESVSSAITQNDLTTIKKVIRSAYKTLARSTKKQKTQLEQIVQITSHHRVLVSISENEFEITSLFGPLLGHGVFSAVIKPIDLLQGTLAKEGGAALKISMAADEGSAQVLQEVSLLKKIHAKDYVLGIQRPVKLIRDVFKGDARHCHLGPTYECTLADAAVDQSHNSIGVADKLSMAYQLLYGLAHLHFHIVTHGDIKPDNVFCDFVDSDSKTIGPRAYLADFGGAIDHTQEQVIPASFSLTYRLKQDREVSENAYDRNDREAYFEIEKKADIFAMCRTLAEVFIGKRLDDVPMSNEAMKKEGMRQGLSEKSAQLILSGMDVDYRNRPRAETILKSIRSDLAILDPQRFKWLSQLEQPLRH